MKNDKINILNIEIKSKTEFFKIIKIRMKKLKKNNNNNRIMIS